MVIIKTKKKMLEWLEGWQGYRKTYRYLTWSGIDEWGILCIFSAYEKSEACLMTKVCDHQHFLCIVNISKTNTDIGKTLKYFAELTL